MRSSPWYIALLVAFVGGSAGYVYATSEVLTVRVTAKTTELVQGRRGERQLYVVDTDAGRLPILQFPVIGYTTGAEQAFASIGVGSTQRVRVGTWPPSFLGGSSRRYIMAVEE